MSSNARSRAARRILLNAGRDADAARLGQAFEACCDIDAIAEDVAVLDNDVTLVDADAELDATAQGYWGVALGHCRPAFRPAHQSVDDAGELDQEPIAGGLDDAALVASDLRIDQLGAKRLEAS